MLPRFLVTITPQRYLQAFLTFSTSLHHRTENKQKKNMVSDAHRSWPHVEHCGGTCYWHIQPAYTPFYYPLWECLCQGNLGGQGKDILLLQKAEGVFFPLGMLNKLCGVHLCFDCNLPHEVRCGIVHLWHQLALRKLQILEHFRFQILRFGMMKLYWLSSMLLNFF